MVILAKPLISMSAGLTRDGPDIAAELKGHSQKLTDFLQPSDC
jgi:hypothetical protein